MTHKNREKTDSRKGLWQPCALARILPKPGGVGFCHRMYASLPVPISVVAGAIGRGIIGQTCGKQWAGYDGPAATT